MRIRARGVKRLKAGQATLAELSAGFPDQGDYLKLIQSFAMKGEFFFCRVPLEGPEGLTLISISVCNNNTCKVLHQ